MIRAMNLAALGEAHQVLAMNRLRDGARKSDTIIGKFQLIQSLEAKTTRKLPDSILNEISPLDNNE